MGPRSVLGRLRCRWAMAGSHDVFRAAYGLTLLSAVGCAGSPSVGVPEGPVALRLRALDGTETQTLGALRGKIVVIHIMTTWSEPALLEIPRLSAIASRYADDVHVLAVTLDEDRRMGSIFVDSFHPGYGVLTVDEPGWFTSSAGPFGPITVIPSTVILDRRGHISARMDGMWPPELLERAVKTLLKP